MCFNVDLLLKANEHDRVFVLNDPVNWVDPWGLQGDWAYGYNYYGLPRHPSSSVMYETLTDEDKECEDRKWMAEPPADEFYEMFIGGSVGKTGRKINLKRAQKWKDAIVKLTNKKKLATTKAEKQAIARQLKHARTKLKTSEPHGITGQ